MTGQTCSTHPGAVAAYRCDGCGQLLCDQCAEEGHRLVFCRLCGERALPLDASGRAVEVRGGLMERRRQAIVQSATGYGLEEAFLYAFRGVGGQVFLAYVVTLTLLDAVAMFLPLVGGCVTMVPWVAVMLLIPGFLFRISNSTAQGRNELPDWPDFDVGELVRTALLFAAVVIVSLLPAYLLLELAGCTLGNVMMGEVSVGACMVALAVGLLLAVALWIPTFGAVSLYDTFVAALRVDLHARALLVAPREIAITVPLLAFLLFSRFFVPLVLGFIPFLGIVLGHAVVGYTLFTGAHLVGLYFRRHWGELEELYLG